MSVTSNVSYIILSPHSAHQPAQVAPHRYLNVPVSHRADPHSEYLRAMCGRPAPILWRDILILHRSLVASHRSKIFGMCGTIDAIVITVIDYDALNSLPENSSIYDHLHNVEAVTVTSDQHTDVNNSNGTNDEISNLTSNGFVPSLQSNEREIAELQNALQVMEAILTMPAVHGAAINEHEPNMQYMIDGFATLFSSGKADCHAVSPYKITASFYFEHLMRYKDGRFAKHPRFRYFAWNSLLRWNAKKRTWVFVRRNLSDEAMTVGNEV
jgi:hypothetical protein